jgi:hypothetical protein
MRTATTSHRRPAAATAVAWLAVVGAIGAAYMVVSHVELYRADVVPLGVPAGFVLGALLFASVAYGAFRTAWWAWPAALAVNGVGLLSALVPWRGPQALVPAAVTLAALLVLLSPSGRRALPRRR